MNIKLELHNLKRKVLNGKHISDQFKKEISDKIFQIEQEVAITVAPCSSAFFIMKEQDFLENGFIKDTEDPMFKFRKELIESSEVESLNLSFDEIPSLLYGTTGVNKGFCIYTGGHFVFLNFDNVKEAVSFSEKIVAFEQV